MNIPFVDLSREAEQYLPELINNTKQVLKSGQYINGSFVKALEESVANYLGVKYAISVGNGSDALTFILRTLNIKEDDEIICPANSFIATSWSIVAAGAKPIFCDVNEDYLLDPHDFERRITEKTKAVIVVHLTGRVFEINLIKEICSKKNIKIIEDAAQSFGAFNNKRIMTGALGLAGAFSLHPLKNFAIYGDGGIISTNNKLIAEKCMKLRNHGLVNRDEAEIWGYNSRLDELQASYALVKLNNIEDLTHKYINIAKYYDKNITNKVFKPEIRNTQRDVYHNYVIRVPLMIRDSLMQELLKCGVETKIHYPIPLHLQKCASKFNYKLGDIPNVETFSKSMISLPIHPYLSEEELDYVCTNFNRIYNNL